MPSTPGLALPYPTLDDTPDVPFFMQQLAQAVEAKLSGLPRCKIVQGADQAIAGLTTVDFAGGTVAYDNAGMADLASDAIVIKKAGLYVFNASLRWANSTGGYRAGIITRGAGDFLCDDYRSALPTNAAQPYTWSSDAIQCAVGDVITLRTTVTNGPVTLGLVNGRRSHLAAYYLPGQ